MKQGSIMLVTTHQEEVEGSLWPPAGADGRTQTYVILDGARDGLIYPNVLLSATRHACLFGGDLPEELAMAAPYLLELRPGTPFTKWLITRGWGRSWGIFLRSGAGLEDLRRHFRRFLVVREEAGKRLFFRYYDPRVLRLYLPTCTRQELDFVFGPVDRFLVEDPETGGCRVYARRKEEPVEQETR